MRPSRPPLSWALALLVLAAAACTAQEATGPAPLDRFRRPGDDPALRDAAFDPAALRSRRAELVAALGSGAVAVVHTPKAVKDVVPYRPAPDFLYLSGQRDAGLTLLICADEDLIFAPPYDAGHERWNGARLAVGTPLAEAAGFGEVVLRTRRKERIQAALTRHGGPLFLSGISAEELGLSSVTTKVKSLRPALSRLRQVKDAAELRLLERAVDITCAALLETMASLRPGQFEYEAQAVIEYLFARYGAQRPGFTSIVGAGPNSCILHYNSNRRRLEAGDLVVMDVGAELWGYTADVTRTVPVSGRFTPRQREIYELVLAAQAAGIAAVRPGATMREVDAAARKVIGDAGYGRFFLHGTSHWLGLDVHDVGPRDRPFEPGMVLTVEPGIYLAEEALGVRIEDDVLVTEEGRRVLSEGVPREVEAIEALLNGDGVGARAVAPLPARGKQGKPGRFF